MQVSSDSLREFCITVRISSLAARVLLGLVDGVGGYSMWGCSRHAGSQVQTIGEVLATAPKSVAVCTKFSIRRGRRRRVSREPRNEE